MIIFERLRLENFLSYEEFEFHFKNNPIMVQGINLTDDNQESNGSGKSGFQEGLFVALTSMNSRKERDGNIIRDGEKCAVVELDLYCEQRGERLFIKRELKKSGSKLYLFLGSEPVQFSNVRDGNEFILNWLDTNKDDLFSYYLINNERFKSFFTSSNKEKLELVGRLADTNFLDSAQDYVKDDVKELGDSLKDVHGLINRLEGKKESFEETINTLSLSIKGNKDAVIDGLKAEIEALDEDIYKCNDSIQYQDTILNETSKGIDAQKESVSACESQQIDVSELEAEIEDLSSERLQILKMKAEAEKLLAGKIQCPKCSHEFVLGEDVDVSLEEQCIADCIEVIEGFDTELVEKRKDVDRANVKKKELSSLRVELEKLELGILKVNRAISKLESDIVLHESTKASKQAKIQQILDAKPVDNTEQIEQLKQSIKETEVKIGEEIANIEILENEIFEVKQWETNFKRFKMNLANDTILSIQNTCNRNLDKMKSDLRVKVDGFKVKADGSIKEEITPHVVRDTVSSYHRYSGGEKGRVQFAMILSIQELINASNKYGGLNILAVDEIFEGIDGTGLNHLMKSIRDININALVTTHVTDRKVSGEKLVIEKVNGISRIREE